MNKISKTKRQSIGKFFPVILDILSLLICLWYGLMICFDMLMKRAFYIALSYSRHKTNRAQVLEFLMSDWYH